MMPRHRWTHTIARASGCCLQGGAPACAGGAVHGARRHVRLAKPVCYHDILWQLGPSSRGKHCVRLDPTQSWGAKGGPTAPPGAHARWGRRWRRRPRRCVCLTLPPGRRLLCHADRRSSTRIAGWIPPRLRIRRPARRASCPSASAQRPVSGSTWRLWRCAGLSLCSLHPSSCVPAHAWATTRACWRAHRWALCTGPSVGSGWLCGAACNGAAVPVCSNAARAIHAPLQQRMFTGHVYSAHRTGRRRTGTLVQVQAGQRQRAQAADSKHRQAVKGRVRQ